MKEKEKTSPPRPGKYFRIPVFLRSCWEGMYDDHASKALKRMLEVYTHDEVAGLVGTTPAKVRSWESGRKKLSIMENRAIVMAETIVADCSLETWRRYGFRLYPQSIRGWRWESMRRSG